MTVRLAMWSGPRNISTAMMRAWDNRPDTVVVDEPFYAAYLARTYRSSARLGRSPSRNSWTSSNSCRRFFSSIRRCVAAPICTIWA